MDELVYSLMQSAPTILLVVIALISLYTLAKGADFLVDEAVTLSVQWGVPKMIIGATIVSLGTTLPEVSVSVLAAINGNADLALGNAIGSIIVDTGLILGIAAIMGVIHVDKKLINFQGRIQIGVAVLLTIFCLPIFGVNGNGVVHQWMGFVLVALLIGYIYISIKSSKQASTSSILDEDKPVSTNSSTFILILKIIFGISLVILSSKILIPAVEISAIRVGIPESIIAATLVAFGTSLPELMTAISSVRKGHGDLAVGNIIGADILNVLFVIGLSAAFTPMGLSVPSNFYILQFPTMLIILLAFRLFAKNKGGKIVRWEGIVLVSMYLIYLVLNYTLKI